jgi:hypothetical protein
VPKLALFVGLSTRNERRVQFRKVPADYFLVAVAQAVSKFAQARRRAFVKRSDNNPSHRF